MGDTVARQHMPRRWRERHPRKVMTHLPDRLLWMVAGAFWLALAAAILIRPTVQIEISPSLVRADSGHAYMVPISQNWILGDDRFSRSTLKVLENGAALGPAHSVHDRIRTHGGGAYSHWGRYLFFSASDNSDPRSSGYHYLVVAELAISAKLFVLSLLFSAMALFASWRLRSSTTTRVVFRAAALVHVSIALAFIGSCALVLLYLGTIVSALLLDIALPAAFVFRFFEGGGLNTVAHLIPYALLVASLIGAAMSWSAVPGRPCRRAMQRAEILGLRLSGRMGLPLIILLLLFILASGGWSYSLDPNDSPDLSIAGVIPHSDASDYFGDALEMAYRGQWGWISSLRPLAAAFRDFVTLLAGYSYTASQLVQLLALSAAIYWATRGVARWLGLWAGLGFPALSLIMTRPFLSTTMTEP